ncbi:MAG TPA: hypothetical protein VFH99_01380 [Candidatus Saccharimonadales bacterium]|nr:hypothetical protein [Candidatus Saccharimonadales bacterium]
MRPKVEFIPGEMPNGAMPVNSHTECLPISRARAFELAALEIGSALVTRVAEENQRFKPQRVTYFKLSYTPIERMGDIGQEVPEGYAAILISARDTQEVRVRSWRYDSTSADILEERIAKQKQAVKRRK